MTSNDFDNRVVALYLAGASQHEVARKMHCSRAPVRRVLAAAGVTRTVQESMQFRDYTGVNNPNWHGGRHLHEKGYVRIKLPDHPRADPKGYVYEHIVVAEAKVDRPLKEREQVHHKDRDRANNDPSNLVVLTESEHIDVHRHAGDVHTGAAAKQGWLWEASGGGEWAEQQRQKEQMEQDQFESREVNQVPF